MESSKDEIEKFISELNGKLLIKDLYFEPRDKKKQGLEDLDILPKEREEYVKKITVYNYVSGPNEDVNDKNRPPYFVFGMDIKGIEVYIKLTVGNLNKPAVCLSFHQSKFPLKYPYKKG